MKLWNEMKEMDKWMDMKSKMSLNIISSVLKEQNEVK